MNFFILYYSPKNLHLRNYTEHFHNTTLLNKNKKKDLNFINDNFRSFNNSNLLNETEEHYNNENITYIYTYNNNTYNNITVPDNNDIDIERPQIIIIHLSLTEILLFSSVILATDTIAALTFIHEDLEPKLFAILFGEGVMNDAVCIVLYRILGDFTSSVKILQLQLLL